MPIATINSASNGSGSGAGGGYPGTNASSSRNSPAIASTSTSTNPPASRMRAANAAANGSAPATAPPHAPPLSSMKSAPLDLSTVERRGQPTEVPEPVIKKSRPFDLEEAPTYRPTEEEWKEPMEYMRKIAPEAREYGICKIIPPDSWNPEFAIDTEKFHFRTRKQELNSVEGSTRANLAYLDGLSKFHKQRGNNLHRLPYVDKKPLDLYKLKKAVETRGGFDMVCKLKKWAEIGRDLGYSGKIMSSLSTSLKNSYQKWLCPYEEYLKLAKPGVHQQLEYEYGGPLGTPSPATTPFKKSSVNTPIGSPARHATDALQASLSTNGFKDPDRDTPMTDAPPAPVSTPAPAPAPTPTSGFRAINSGGFTAVNSGFTSVNRPLVAADTPSKPAPLQIAAVKSTPDIKLAPLAPATSLKRQLSCESSDSGRRDVVEKEDDVSGRRSKRVKKETVPTVAGSHMTLFKSTGPRMPRDESAAPGEKCEQCGRGENPNTSFITCESCDYTYHGTCLDPPIMKKPETEWNCPRCIVGDGQFGFEDGGLYSLRQFQQKAAQFKQTYFEKKMPVDPVLGCARPVTEEDVEKEFWRLVVDLEETVEVEYGADIHCTTHGSGFPTAEKHPNNPYSTHPWNLNILPLHGDSLFRHIKSDISGMTVPWVYVGMTFSTFCWHNEDHYSYSANYQHFGATKTWYGIPGADAQKFEDAMREAVPELFETQPDLLFQLVTLLTPEHLKKAGVRVYAVDQRAGQMVVTFPQAYHAGFNHGFNFNEAVNFAPCDWEPFGLAGVERLQAFRRQPCFSHDELLFTAAEGQSSGGLTIQTAKWLLPALQRVHDREKGHRDAFVDDWHGSCRKHACPLRKSEGDSTCPLTLVVEDKPLAEEEYQCAHCKAFTYLSRFKCHKSGKVMCLVDAMQHACCDMPQEERALGYDHTLHYRKSEEDLVQLLEKVYEKAHLPENWEKKYDSLLQEEAMPSLKTLRTLLHEGERIPYEIPCLHVLREFVDRCNEWVDEAAFYTVRKQQNRRKSDKGSRKSTGPADKKDADSRTVEHIQQLILDAERIGFECTEINQLRERLYAVQEFERRVNLAIDTVATRSLDEIEDLLKEAHSFNVDIPQVEKLCRISEQLQWNDRAKLARQDFMTMEDVRTLVQEGKKLAIPPYNDHLKHFEDQMSQGAVWESRAKDVIAQEIVHHSQLENLFNQVKSQRLPVSKETYNAVDQILHKHREAHKQVVDILERSHHDDFRRRPKYAEMAVLVKKLDDMNSKPSGTTDLEREQKRHEDWMRKGKKLFGKTNAPLHILKSHLEYVLERNRDCFDTVHDKPRLPAEPSSRAASPSSEDKDDRMDESGFREVFCICRKPEAGLMIECEVCHEWYHSKCLKIARGKIKEEDKYTCPICDWRVKIPRDAARPKVEDLIDWYEEIPRLPFQPEEEDVLKDIIDNAQDFRIHVSSLCNPILATPMEQDHQRFYLRKIEGAEILLAYETNHFRQELHKWCPVAPEPPPVQDISLSTRKPRPTKLQKIMAQYKAEALEDLPDDVRAKAHSLRRKQLNNEAATQPFGPGMMPVSGGPGERPTSTSPTYPHTAFFSVGRPPSRINTAPLHGTSLSVHSTSPSESGLKGGTGTPLSANAASSLPVLSMGFLTGSHDASRTREDIFDDWQISTSTMPDWDARFQRAHEERMRLRNAEILARREPGRPSFWGQGSVSAGPVVEDEGDVDKMFTDLTNHGREGQEDEDEARKGKTD